MILKSFFRAIRGLLSHFFSKKLIVEDEVFGRLVFSKIASEQEDNSYWSGEVPFPPAVNVIYITLFGDDTGPTEAQRKFFLLLTQVYDQVHQDVTQFVEEHKTKRIKAMNFQNMHQLRGVILQRIDQGPIDWDLHYTTNYAYGDSLMIRMADLKPQEIFLPE